MADERSDDWAKTGGLPHGPFETRGVVLLPEDLTLKDWPERAKWAGLTTIALHHAASPEAVARWIESEAGREFLEACRRLGLAVEYALHAMRELLPRERFATEPGLFRMNDRGERTPDANLCVHSRSALEIVAENTVALAARLRPTTGRYFLWGDDDKGWCRCPQCRELSDSDQALLLENHLWRALRRHDDRATLSHLAYSSTLAAPVAVKPEPGVFLEFAPIHRRYDVAYAEQSGPEWRNGIDHLDANLQVFPAATAQALEYWLDVSRFSHWRRPAVQVLWNRELFLADLAAYRARGVRHVTTFAAWLDADYVARFGEPAFLDEYGAGLI